VISFCTPTERRRYNGGLESAAPCLPLVGVLEAAEEGGKNFDAVPQILETDALTKFQTQNCPVLNVSPLLGTDEIRREHIIV
jgi:hypothetical protein